MVRDDLLFLTDFLPLADDEDFYEALAGPDLLDPASGRSAIDGARGKLSKDDIINKGVPSIAICCFKESQVSEKMRCTHCSQSNGRCPSAEKSMTMDMLSQSHQVQRES